MEIVQSKCVTIYEDYSIHFYYLYYISLFYSMPENTKPKNVISLPCNPCILCGKDGIMYLNFTFVILCASYRHGGNRPRTLDTKSQIWGILGVWGWGLEFCVPLLLH